MGLLLATVTCQPMANALPMALDAPRKAGRFFPKNFLRQWPAFFAELLATYRQLTKDILDGLPAPEAFRRILKRAFENSEIMIIADHFLHLLELCD